MIREWLATRRLVKAERRFHKGYDYAAGALLRGVPAAALNVGYVDDDEFDKGMSKACEDFAKQPRLSATRAWFDAFTLDRCGCVFSTALVDQWIHEVFTGLPYTKGPL